jgi:hypothetical protein
MTEATAAPPDTDKINQEIVALQAERDRSWKRKKKLQEQIRQCEKREAEIMREIHRQRLLLLVGVPDGVRPHFRLNPGQRGYELNDAKGTLVVVRRTRTTVLFNGESWDFPTWELLPADQQQGMSIRL